MFIDQGLAWPFLIPSLLALLYIRLNWTHHFQNDPHFKWAIWICFFFIPWVWLASRKPHKALGEQPGRKFRLLSIDKIMLVLSWLAISTYFMEFKYFYTVSFRAVLLLVLAGLLIFFKKNLMDLSMQRWGQKFIIIFFLVICVVTSFQTGPIQVAADSFFHHAGVYVTVIEQIRHGHWLLWDTPSQYGWLNVLFISQLPIQSAWTTFQLTHGCLLVLQALFLFLITRKALGTGIISLILAGCLSYICTYILPGNGMGLNGPLPFPSVGAMRFVWVTSTFLYLCNKSNLRESPKILMWESLLFVLSAIWSAESFFYCTLIWLGYDGGEWFNKHDEETRRRILRRTGTKFISLAAALTAISTYYQIQLGHGPDFKMFFDFVIGFGNGFGALPFCFPGPIFLFLFVLMLFGFVLQKIVLSQNENRPLNFLMASFAMFWGCTTYFFGRSHPDNATNLSSVILMMACALLISLDKISEFKFKKQIKLWFSPFILGLALMLVQHKNVPAGIARILNHSAPIESLLPQMEPAQKRLVNLAGISENDPIVALEENLIKKNGDQNFSNPWLPIVPLAAGYPLTTEHSLRYLQRRLDLTLGCGWILDTKDSPYGPGLHGTLHNAGWIPEKVFKEENNQLTQWCKGTSS